MLYEHAMKPWEAVPGTQLQHHVSQRGVMMLAHNVHDVQSFKRHIYRNQG